MYATYDELITRYPSLKTWGVGRDEVSSGLLYYAGVQLNGMLGTHFSVPFSAAHPTVVDLQMDLAYYRAYLTRDPEKVEGLYDDIIGRVAAIKAGQEALYTESGTVIEAEGPNREIWSTVKDYHPVFSMLDAEDPLSTVDSDLLDADAAERI